MKSGVALNPHTHISLLRDILPLCDVVCLMSVNPGFGGQKFIEYTYNKIKELKSMIQSMGLNTLIEIDGGVALSNAKELVECGANVLVAGNTVFGSENPTKTISELVELTK
jgi:ribulose-phosphate 3-epimerase